MFSKQPFLYIKNSIFVAVVVLLISFGFAYIYSGVFSEKNIDQIVKSDFVTYYNAAYMIKNGKVTNIYSKVEQLQPYEETYLNKYPNTATLRYVNFPLVAVLFIPLTNLEPFSAYKVFSGVNVLLLLSFVILLMLLKKAKTSTLAIYLLYLPIYGGLYYGQLSVILLMILVLILWAVKTEKTLVAGLLSGLLIIKLQYLILVPFTFLIVKNKLRYFLGCVSVITAFILLNISFYGSDLFSDVASYLTVIAGEHVTAGIYYNLFSLNTFDYNFLVFLTTTLYIAGLYFIYKRKRELEIEVMYGSIVIFMLLLNFHTTYSDLIFLCIPLLIFSQYRNDWKKFIYIMVLYILPYANFIGVKNIFIIFTLIIGYINLTSTQDSPFELSYKHAQNT